MTFLDAELVEEKPESPDHTLHPVRGVVWAAFWGTPVAAGIVMALNYARVGRGGAAFLSAAIGALATAGLFALMMAIGLLSEL